MITGELKSRIGSIWNAFWSGGISNPLEVIEQITRGSLVRVLADDASPLLTGRPLPRVGGGSVSGRLRARRPRTTWSTSDDGYVITVLARLVWSTVVLVAGWGLAHGLWLSTYFERTEQARVDDARGELWLWVSTLFLVGAALVARWCWRTPAWSGALLVAAGGISLLCSDADFLPLLALLMVAPMLLVSVGVTVVHRCLEGC